MRTSTETLIAACKELAATVQCDDGVANSALREIAERLEELSQWITITERLPDPDIPVFFCCLINGEFEFVDYGWPIGNKTNIESFDWLPGTHWRTWPELPKVKE